MGDFIEYSAKTKSEAITKACIEQGVISDQLEIQVVSEGSSGFFGIGSKPAVIRVRRIQEDPTEVEIREMVENVSASSISSVNEPEKKKARPPKPQKKEKKPELKEKKNPSEDKAEAAAEAEPELQETPSEEKASSNEKEAGRKKPYEKKPYEKKKQGRKDSSRPEPAAEDQEIKEETDNPAEYTDEEGTEKSERPARRGSRDRRGKRHYAGRTEEEKSLQEEELTEEAEKAPVKAPRPVKILTDPEQIALVEERAKKFLVDVFACMDLGEVEIHSKYNGEEGSLDVDFEGEDMGVLIGKRGQTLDSLQYLTSLVVNKGLDDYVRVKLDTEDYRRRRKETLENLARGIAYKVKKTRRPVVLEPMNPYERRIIHSALQGNRYVETMSEGEEPYRHVIVKLKKM